MLTRCRPSTMRTPRHPLPQRARGFALLEVLIAFLIFAFGVLGFVGLQVQMVKAQTSAKFRGDAAVLASELTGSMWTDIANLTQYTAANCAGHPRCNDWANKVAATLPNGAATVTVAAGVVSITITWSAPGEGQHNYVTASAIQG